MKKNKVLILIGVVIIIAIIVVCIVYFIDIRRINNNEEVLYSTWGYDYTPPENDSSVDNTNDLSENGYFVGTVLEETTEYMIVEPNDDEIERKSSDKIRINYGVDHRDYLYGIGRKVVIGYNGFIMESYPAQINSNDIRLGYSDFELDVNLSEKKEVESIFQTQEDERELLYYAIDDIYVNINEINKTLPLKDALNSRKIQITQIMANANIDNDIDKNTISISKNGDYVSWTYEDYMIIKDGYKLYIAPTGSTLDEINKVIIMKDRA